MAAAIPAAIGVGSSLIGGISGKGAAKKQQKLAEQQLRQLQPLIDAQITASQFGLNTARDLYGRASGMFDPARQAIETVYNDASGQFESLTRDYKSLLEEGRSRAGELYGTGRGLSRAGAGLLGGSLPYLRGASTALEDLQKFYRPFMFEGQRAIDRFLPSAQRTNQLLAPEFGNINQGYRSASENIAKFAPRGGGRVSSLARADIDRQKQISDVFFQGRQNLSNQALGAAFQGASGQQNVAQALQALGISQGQLGLGTIGQGLNTIGTGTSLLGTQGGLAQNAMGQALQALGLKGSAANNMAQLASEIGRLGAGALGEGLSGGGQAYNLYNQQANRAYGVMPRQNTGKGLGGYLVDLFGNSSVQNKLGGLFGGPKSSLPEISFGS